MLTSHIPPTDLCVSNAKTKQFRFRLARKLDSGKHKIIMCKKTGGVYFITCLLLLLLHLYCNTNMNNENLVYFDGNEMSKVVQFNNFVVSMFEY